MPTAGTGRNAAGLTWAKQRSCSPSCGQPARRRRSTAARWTRSTCPAGPRLPGNHGTSGISGISATNSTNSTCGGSGASAPDGRPSSPAPLWPWSRQGRLSRPTRMRAALGRGSSQRVRPSGKGNIAKADRLAVPNRVSRPGGVRTPHPAQVPDLSCWFCGYRGSPAGKDSRLLRRRGHLCTRDCQATEAL